MIYGETKPTLFFNYAHSEPNHMWQWIHQNLSDIGLVISGLTLLLSIFVLAFSAWRYVQLRKEEQRTKRYQQYHELLSKISRGTDADGVMKLISQRAYVYELRHFPEYSSLTTRLLESLLSEWNEPSERTSKLVFEIQDTIRAMR